MVHTNFYMVSKFTEQKKAFFSLIKLKKLYYLIIMKYFLENGPEWGRRSVSGRVSRLLFRQILPPFILKEIVPRELLPSND
jgi:hypothetical protein